MNDSNESGGAPQSTPNSAGGLATGRTPSDGSTPDKLYSPKAFSLRGWIDEHRHLLKPPVGNKQVFEDADFIIMVVAGPNNRKDFHINTTEEFFYQVEGDISLGLMVDGKRVDVPIKEGDIYLLPAGVPHSPQRPAGTVGLVVERQRTVDDKLVWYCESCGELLHSAAFQLKDIATQIKAAIEVFYADEALRSCGGCGAVMSVPSA